jgi:hypothetical protein
MGRKAYDKAGFPTKGEEFFFGFKSTRLELHHPTLLIFSGVEQGDTMSHLYTLVIRGDDDSYEVLVDMKSEAKG